MGEVFVIYGNQVENMVRQLIEKAGVMDRLRPDDKVMIKPNLLVSRQNWVGINTDPRVVEALVKTLKERGVRRITVGDGSGMGYSATKAFEYCGYRDMASRYGLNLVDLERDEFIKKPVRMEGPFKSLEIARTVLECDFFINVPLMKAHNETLMTCSLKNLKGAMSRAMKTAFHGVNLHKAPPVWGLKIHVFITCLDILPPVFVFVVGVPQRTILSEPDLGNHNLEHTLNFRIS